jgi:hypothetical protein
MKEITRKYIKHIIQETNVLFFKYFSAKKVIVVPVAVINNK